MVGDDVEGSTQTRWGGVRRHMGRHSYSVAERCSRGGQIAILRGDRERTGDGMRGTMRVEDAANALHLDGGMRWGRQRAIGYRLGRW